MQLVQQSNAAHWYINTGTGQFEPLHEVPRADGKGTRPTTLADARKRGLYPSVTTIFSVLNKPALNDWRVEQGIMAALTLPRLDNEPIDGFAHRVVKDMDSQSSVARDFGADIHKAIEYTLTRPGYEVEPTIAPFIESFGTWASSEIQEIHGAELCVGDPTCGFAGKLDLDCTLKGIGRAVVDIKTQRVKNGKPICYEEWAIQLAAYRQCRILAEDEPFGCVSLIIDSTKPGPIHVKLWEDPDSAWVAFVHALSLWCYLKDYWPTQTRIVPQPLLKL